MADGDFRSSTSWRQGGDNGGNVGADGGGGGGYSSSTSFDPAFPTPPPPPPPWYQHQRGADGGMGRPPADSTTATETITITSVASSLPSQAFSNSTSPHPMGPPRPPLEAILIPCMAGIIVLLAFIIICLWRRWVVNRRLLQKLLVDSSADALGDRPVKGFGSKGKTGESETDGASEIQNDAWMSRDVETQKGANGPFGLMPDFEKKTADDSGPSLPPSSKFRPDFGGGVAPSAPSDDKTRFPWEETIASSSSASSSSAPPFSASSSSAAVVTGTTRSSPNRMRITDSQMQPPHPAIISAYEGHQRRQLTTQRNDSTWSASLSSAFFGTRRATLDVPPPYEDVAAPSVPTSARSHSRGSSGVAGVAGSPTRLPLSPSAPPLKASLQQLLPALPNGRSSTASALSSSSSSSSSSSAFPQHPPSAANFAAQPSAPPAEDPPADVVADDPFADGLEGATIEPDSEDVFADPPAQPSAPSPSMASPVSLPSPSPFESPLDAGERVVPMSAAMQSARGVVTVHARAVEGGGQRWSSTAMPAWEMA
ncbi:hypothetical protein DFJ73DRAFT_308500 [Zopfochytrium polystomum]|nr:hypothetical protein DFJ73DRAFT_308500 [Zopfochytrium polystomum]